MRTSKGMVRAVAGFFAVVALLVAGTGTASAKVYESSDNDGVAAIKVADPKVVDGGWAVQWKLWVRCPAGEPYTVTTYAAELSPAALPSIAGEDYGITAVAAPVQGVCGNGWQLVAADMPVITPTAYEYCADDPTMTIPVGNCAEKAVAFASVPISASTDAAVAASVSGDGFFVWYCAAPNCATETGDRVRLK